MTVINARHAGKQVSYLVDWIQAEHGACTHSDTTGERFFHQTGWWWVVIVGYIISLSTLKTAARYFSMFLMTAGYCGTYLFRTVPHRLFLSDSWPVLGFTLTLVWVANAIPRPPAKRSAAIGLVNGFGNLGNLYVLFSVPYEQCQAYTWLTTGPDRAGSYIWKANWGPAYHQSMIIALCALAFASSLSFGACLLFSTQWSEAAWLTSVTLAVRVLLVRDNKRMDREEMDLMHGPERERIEEAARLEGISFEEAVRRRKGFRYLY